MNLVVIAIGVIVIYTAAVGYIGFCVGQEHAKKEEDITCYTCKKEDDCVVHQMSNCDWCEQWEDTE